MKGHKVKRQVTMGNYPTATFLAFAMQHIITDLPSKLYTTGSSTHEDGVEVHRENLMRQLVESI